MFDEKEQRNLKNWLCRVILYGDFNSVQPICYLSLGITRRISQLQKDGTYADAPALILHALWWDSNAHGEEAKYAMLPIENGALSPSSIEVHSLEQFVTATDEPYHAVAENFNPSVETLAHGHGPMSRDYYIRRIHPRDDDLLEREGPAQLLSRKDDT